MYRACRFKLFAFLISCLSLTALHAQSGQPAAHQFPKLDAGFAVGEGSDQPCFKHLEGDVRCGRFRVFEDRESRSGKTIDLAFVIARALQPSRDQTDAVTFFFGGPGASATQLAPATIGSNRGRRLRRQRDLLFLDFRGVGHSQPLNCDVPYPGGIQSRFDSLFPLDHIKACRDQLTKRARLEFYTSQMNMDDLDELRRWLEYESLSLIGGSYGSREIQVYLRRHGDSARAALLTAVSPIFTGGYVTHARGLQQALDKLVAECAGQAKCSRDYPDFGKTLRQTLEMAKGDPPEVVLNGAPVHFGAGALGYALRGLLYTRAEQIPRFVSQAANGNWQALARYYFNRTGWVGESSGLVSAGMHFSVLCAEDIARLSRQEIDRETAGTFLGDHLIGGYKDVCDLWPHASLDPSFWQPVRTEVPALFLSGERDPVTPPAGAEAVAGHFANSLHLVVNNAGHGFSGPCVDDIQVQFINSGSIENLDTSCLGSRPSTDFRSR
jgi:pimeloyl-ACP methyl ester carboxylesterase